VDIRKCHGLGKGQVSCNSCRFSLKHHLFSASLFNMKVTGLSFVQQQSPWNNNWNSTFASFVVSNDQVAQTFSGFLHFPPQFCFLQYFELTEQGELRQNTISELCLAARGVEVWTEKCRYPWHDVPESQKWLILPVSMSCCQNSICYLCKHDTDRLEILKLAIFDSLQKTNWSFSMLSWFFLCVQLGFSPTRNPVFRLFSTTRNPFLFSTTKPGYLKNPEIAVGFKY